MSIKPERKTREALFRDLVELHQSIAGSPAADLPAAVTQDLEEALERAGDDVRASRFIEHFQQTEALLQSAAMLICRFLPGGKLIYANDAYQRFFGGTTGTLTGPAYLPSIPPDEVDFVRSRVELIRRDHPLVTYEAAFDLPGGRRWVQWNEEGVFDADGKLVAYQALGLDVTGIRLQLQEAERETNRKNGEG